MINICLSGGAVGADTTFGNCAESVGHTVVHYVFHGMRTKCKNGLIFVEQENLLKADPYLKQANKILKRRFPTSSGYVNNLLRRNYYQVKETKRVYAVSSISDGLVS